jgi:hypothetical protein
LDLIEYVENIHKAVWECRLYRLMMASDHCALIIKEQGAGFKDTEVDRVELSSAVPLRLTFPTPKGELIVQ